MKRASIVCIRVAWRDRDWDWFFSFAGFRREGRRDRWDKKKGEVGKEVKGREGQRTKGEGRKGKKTTYLSLRFLVLLFDCLID